MIKKILLTLMSIFLAFQAFNLMRKIDIFETDSWILTIIFAWILNMIVTGIFAFAGFAWPTERLMPNNYFQVKAPKQLKKWCKVLGVAGFRKFLLATVWRSKAQRAKYFDGTANGIANFEVQSRKAEFGHFFPLVLLTFLSVYLLVIGQVGLGVATFVFNVLGNFYPVLLQRHHRMRLDVLKRRYLN